MASTLIHLCVSKKLNEKLKFNEKELFLGSIAPDISKQINRTKQESHFLYKLNNNVPNTELFYKKYKKVLNKPFNLGYYIHLLTDKYWYENFINNIKTNEFVKLIDGTIINTTEEEINNLIYNDYTNLNIDLIDYYNLDLSLFYEEFKIPESDILEIPIEDLNILIDKMGIIIENSKKNKEYILDLTMINNFINECTNKILTILKKQNIIS